MAGATYNVTRFTRQVLKRHRKEPPSLVLHLYPTHFRFEQQHGNFNYDSPMKCFLEAIREQKLPTDLLDVLDEAGVRYYEGCLIVEVHDHRSDAPTPTLTRPGFQLGRVPQAAPVTKAEVYRIVLGPNPATLWTELGILEKRMMDAQAEATAGDETAEAPIGWTEEQAVEIEAAILVSRIANSMLRATTLRPPKRKRFCGTECDEDEDGEEGLRREREEHERMMRLGDEGIGRGRGHAFARLAFIQSYRERQNPAPLAPNANGSTATAGGSGITSIRITAPQPSGASTPGTVGSPAASASQPPRKKKASLAATESEAGTPGASGMSAAAASAATSKKLKKAQAQALADANDPTLPTDPVEREKVLEARKKQAAIKKRAENKARKEKKKAAEAAALAQQQASSDLQVGGGPIKLQIPMPAKGFGWSPGGQ